MSYSMLYFVFTLLFIAKSIDDTSLVQLDVYYEACCSNCQKFIIGTFQKAFNTPGWINITRISFIPWGKCNEIYDATTNEYIYQCQHGPNECRANNVMACAILLYENKSLNYIPFIIDYITQITKQRNGCKGENVNRIAENVCNNMNDGICDWNQLNRCIDSKQGNKIYHQMGSITAKTNLTWVPWIEINNKHTKNQQKICEYDILECTCEKYKGNNPDLNERTRWYI
eukprot:222416_1